MIVQDNGLADILKWLDESPVLQKNDCSRLHRLIEAMEGGKIHRTFGGFTGVEAEPVMPERSAWMLADSHVFVVKHDWLAMLGDENLPGRGELKLPFPICTFEFRISGRNVIVFAAQWEDQLAATGFQEGKNGYWASGEASDSENGPMKFAWKQLLAACVAIDADVATHNVTRAPAALNRKREASGKPKVADFHTVDLAHRHRYSTHRAGVGACKRLHFRRGHWRHFEESKSWVRWCLVGNPELGFVDKDYAL